jgi:hypothetical protein
MFKSTVRMETRSFPAADRIQNCCRTQLHFGAHFRHPIFFPFFLLQFHQQTTPTGTCGGVPIINSTFSFCSKHYTHLNNSIMKVIVSSLLLLTSLSANAVDAFVVPSAAAPAVSALHSTTTPSTTTTTTSELVPPMTLDDILQKDGAVAELYDQHVQKTYGYVRC